MDGSATRSSSARNASARTGPVKLPLHPVHPERVCWGCDQYCPADALTCGNGTERTQHPTELFGDDWYEWANPGDADKA